MNAARWQGEDLILQLRIQPRASRDEIAALEPDHLRVRITAPPVEGRANAHLLRFLAECFAVPKSAVTLLSGTRGRYKRVAVHRPRRLPDVLAGIPDLSKG